MGFTAYLIIDKQMFLIFMCECAVGFTAVCDARCFFRVMLQPAFPLSEEPWSLCAPVGPCTPVGPQRLPTHLLLHTTCPKVADHLTHSLSLHVLLLQHDAFFRYNVAPSVVAT